jgi:hypothetical protein
MPKAEAPVREPQSFETKGEMTDAMKDVTEDAALVAKVEARLAKIVPNDDEMVDDVPAPAANKPVARPIVKPIEAPEDDDIKEKVKDETVVEGPSVEVPEELPMNFHRAALASGWTDTDIQEFVDADPARAFKTFQNIYLTQTRISGQFAALGRKAQETPAAPAAAAKPAEVDDLKEIREQYGDDPILGGVDAILKKRIAQMDERLTRMSGPSNPVHAAAADPTPMEHAQAVVAQQIEQFFGGGLYTKHYGEFYGAGREPQDRTIVQQSRRDEVVMLADQIMAGANAQGLQPSVEEVLERAHFMVSAPAAKKAVVAEIKATAVARSKGISLRPSKTAAAPAPAGNASPAELEKRVEAKLASIFKG